MSSIQQIDVFFNMLWKPLVQNFADDQGAPRIDMWQRE